MKCVLHRCVGGDEEGCHPITITRPLHDVPIGNRPLREVLLSRLTDAGFEPFNPDPTDGQHPILNVAGNAWLSDALLRTLSSSSHPARVIDRHGNLLAWTNTGTSVPSSGETHPADDDSFAIRYAWDLLRVHETVLAAIKTATREGEVSERVDVDGLLAVGEGTRVLSGVTIEGTVVIGRNCKIGPNCYIRGNTSIGDRCHIGQAVELKNSILLSGTNVGHLSYCGDSILGENVNFGAGTITANLRHDGKPQRSGDPVTGELVNTGRRKLGVIVGDGVHTGIHTSIYPGRKMWPNTSTQPGGMVDRDIVVPAAETRS